MDTLERLRLIINESTDYKDKVEPKDHLRNDLGLDSFDVLMMINAIEDHYSIQIEETALERIETVGDIIKRLDKIKSR